MSTTWRVFSSSPCLNFYVGTGPDRALMLNIGFDCYILSTCDIYVRIFKTCHSLLEAPTNFLTALRFPPSGYHQQGPVTKRGSRHLDTTNKDL